MFWALSEGRKIEATPQVNGICPLCTEKVFSKCGEINVWHWSHYKDKECDSWHEPESFWHKHWKMTFGEENSEVTIVKDEKRHRADILTKNNVVIELQNSPISLPIIRKREEFYGEKMIWLVNGVEIKKCLNVKDYWVDEDYNAIKSLPRPPVRWIRQNPEVFKGENGEFFKWKNPRKSWMEVQRPLFIDFGENDLFKVIEGMGTNQIRGKYISKEKFINHYGGDFKYYSQNNSNQL